MRQKFPPCKCIAIDVDGTLVKGGKLNSRLVKLAVEKKEEGFDVILWSARGREHAERAVAEFGLEGVFSAVIGKPGYLVDDLGWGWTKYTRVLKSWI